MRVGSGSVQIVTLNLSCSRSDRLGEAYVLKMQGSRRAALIEARNKFTRSSTGGCKQAVNTTP